MSFGAILYSVLFKPSADFEVVYVFAYKIISDPGLSIIVLSAAINFLIIPL